MEREKGIRIRFVLPAAWMFAMLAALAYVLISWQPHGDSGVLSAAVALGAGIYGLVSIRRNRRAGNRPGWIAAVVLLILAGIIFWISTTIPFCHECDGGVDSPLMRWILADKL